MEHTISKVFNEQYNFWTISCPQGDKITSYKDGEDIKTYSAFTIAYCPKDADLTIYRCITSEEDAKYRKQLEDRLEEERKAELLKEFANR